MGLLIRAALAAALLGAAAAGCAATETRPTAAAGPLTAVDLEGRPQDLDGVLASGGHVALVFWQTWCKSCEREAPGVVAAARAHGKAIRFIGVVPGRDATVEDAEVRAVAARWGYAFPQVRDRDLALTRRFGVSGTPTIIVLGPGRKVLHADHRAPADWAALAGCEEGACPIPPE